MFAKQELSVYIDRKKEYSKNNQLINWLGYRLDHKLFFRPPGNILFQQQNMRHSTWPCMVVIKSKTLLFRQLTKILNGIIIFYNNNTKY